MCGQPEVQIKRQNEKGKNGETLYQVELLGLDVFDPVTMEVDYRSGDDVPAWFLDTNYNDLCSTFPKPRIGAWNNLKKALRDQYEESVCDHLSGTTRHRSKPVSTRRSW